MSDSVSSYVNEQLEAENKALREQVQALSMRSVDLQHLQHLPTIAYSLQRIADMLDVDLRQKQNANYYYRGPG